KTEGALAHDRRQKNAFQSGGMFVSASGTVPHHACGNSDRFHRRFRRSGRSKQSRITVGWSHEQSMRFKRVWFLPQQGEVWVARANMIGRKSIGETLQGFDLAY